MNVTGPRYERALKAVLARLLLPPALHFPLAATLGLICSLSASVHLWAAASQLEQLSNTINISMADCAVGKL